MRRNRKHSNCPRCHVAAVRVAGFDIEYDPSGIGHAWRPATDGTCPIDIQLDIECEIIDGAREACADFTGSNGRHYRWGVR